MTAHVPLAGALAFALAAIRGNAFVWFCPPFSNKVIPFPAKVAIGAGLALPAIGVLEADPLPTSTGGLVEAIVIQVAIGALMGFVIQLFVGALGGAGALVDQFSGLNLPPAIDPLGLDQAPVLGQMYEWLTTALLFTSGGVVLIAEGLGRSFKIVGTQVPAVELQRLPNIIAGDVAAFFAATVEIAAPVVAVVFVTQILLGLLAKSAPQANVYSLSFPIQLLVVLGALAVAMAALPSDLSNLLDRALTQLVGG